MLYPGAGLQHLKLVLWPVTQTTAPAKVSLPLNPLSAPRRAELWRTFDLTVRLPRCANGIAPARTTTARQLGWLRFARSIQQTSQPPALGAPSLLLSSKKQVVNDGPENSCAAEEGKNPQTRRNPVASSGAFENFSLHSPGQKQPHRHRRVEPPSAAMWPFASLESEETIQFGFLNQPTPPISFHEKLSEKVRVRFAFDSPKSPKRGVRGAGISLVVIQSSKKKVCGG